MEISLNTLSPGARGEVISVDTAKELKCKLRAFGLVPGAKLRCSYRCPWGNMTALKLRGGVLIISGEDLKKITVKL